MNAKLQAPIITQKLRDMKKRQRTMQEIFVSVVDSINLVGI